MRGLPARPALPEVTTRRLERETGHIVGAHDPKAEADRRYGAARRARWFAPVTDMVRTMAGTGERCMFCSGSEASQVEHFRPKAVFPLLALTWDNLLWACGLCNQFKGSRFPPDTEPGAQILDPSVDDVWSFFFIDEFGNLSARWRDELEALDPRAVSTVKVLGLDRDALQQSRQQRLEDLRERVSDSLSAHREGNLTLEDLRRRRDQWISRPFQPDVAQYFLVGPGRHEPPFDSLHRVLAG